jgi:hypothetical protein
MHSRHRIVSSKTTRRGKLGGLSIDGRTGLKYMKFCRCVMVKTGKLKN